MTDSRSPTATSQTVDHALRILRAFGADSRELSGSEIARRLGLSRTVAVRILRTLEEAHFVERVPGQRSYRVGVAAFEVGAQYLAESTVLAAAAVLDDLVAQTGHTAYLGVLDSSDAVIMIKREGRWPIRIIWEAGARLPATTTALGKAILMHHTAEDLDRVVGIGSLSGLTERSISSRAQLDQALDAGRQQGWATAENESYPGVCSVGAPVPGTPPSLGLSLSFVNYPHDPTVFTDLGPRVVEAASEVAKRAASYAAYGQDWRDLRPH